MKKILSTIAVIALVLAALVIRNTYLTQDQHILKAEPLPLDYQYSWDQDFEEVFIDAPDGAQVNGLLFKASSDNNQVILYLHGQGYNLGVYWAPKVMDYTKHGYDAFSIDYRGFGKSYGPTSEETLLEDSMLAYDFLKQRYGEENIIVYGQSLGSSFGTYVASKTNPRMLILEAPYYSMLDMAYLKRPYLPKVVLEKILRYPLRTDLWIQEVNVPIHIFHGTKDTLIPYHASERLVKQVANKSNVTLYTLKDWGHNGILYHAEYQKQLKTILNGNL